MYLLNQLLLDLLKKKCPHWELLHPILKDRTANVPPFRSDTLSSFGEDQVNRLLRQDRREDVEEQDDDQENATWLAFEEQEVADDRREARQQSQELPEISSGSTQQQDRAPTPSTGNPAVDRRIARRQTKKKSTIEESLSMALSDLAAKKAEADAQKLEWRKEAAEQHFQLELRRTELME